MTLSEYIKKTRKRADEIEKSISDLEQRERELNEQLDQDTISLAAVQKSVPLRIELQEVTKALQRARVQYLSISEDIKKEFPEVLSNTLIEAKKTLLAETAEMVKRLHTAVDEALKAEYELRQATRIAEREIESMVTNLTPYTDSNHLTGISVGQASAYLRIPRNQDRYGVKNEVLKFIKDIHRDRLVDFIKCEEAPQDDDAD